MIHGLPNTKVHIPQQTPLRSRVAPGESAVAPTSGDSVGNLPSGFSLSSGDFRFEIPAGRVVTVGRLPGSDLLLEDQAVSRNHAQMRTNNGTIELCDAGSSFGTKVNGQKLEPKRWVPLPPGATVSFATVDLKLDGLGNQSGSGTSQQGMSSALHATGGAVGGITGYLLQDNLGHQFTLKQDGEYTLGRSQENSISLQDPTVSRNHGRLRLQDGQLTFQDAGSSNGTSINGTKIEKGQWTPLPANAKIQMGDAVIQLSGVGQPAPLPQQGLVAGLGAAASAVGGPIGAALRTGLQLSDLSALASKQQLENKESYLESLSGAQAQLNKEKGIVDLPKGIPSLVLSDIHARRDFIMKALEHEIDGVKVFDLLKQGKINLVCVGDGMHGEGRAAARWQRAEQDMMQGKQSAAMHQEMIEGFGTMKMVMDLKSEFPENFHFLRGNHDEIKGSFAKYARNVGESAMVQSWVQQNLGQDFLDKYAQFEETMPLVVRGQGFVASHAAPGGTLDRQAVEQRDAKAFAQLSWTENRNWNDQDGDVQARFQKNLKEVGGEGGSWLVGHRPVDEGNFRSQFNGQLVQINAPSDFVVALVPADGKFQPERDVVSLS
ncbi:FHA domain-containing protein [bacterium]|nr:FHA domain-containing protein [bacterium]